MVFNWSRTADAITIDYTVRVFSGVWLCLSHGSPLLCSRFFYAVMVYGLNGSRSSPAN